MFPRLFRLGRINPWLGIAMVSAGALAIRLWSLETVPFDRDEATLIFGVQDVLNGAWPTVGDGSSWGISTHPMVFYLQSIPYALFGPAGIVAALAVESTLAVALLTWLCVRYLGVGSGLLAGSLYAAAPWCIFFGRQPYTEVNQLLQTLAVVAATRLILGGGGWWAVVAILAVAVNGFEYFLGNILWVSLLFTVFLSPRKWFTWWSAGAFAVAFLMAVPYLAVLLPELSRWPQLALQRGKPFNLAEIPKALNLLKLYLGGANLESLWGTPFSEQFPLKDLLFKISDLAMPVFGAGFVSLVYRRAGVTKGLRRVWLGWTIPPLVLLLIQPSPEHLHYFSVLMPLPFLWLASLFSLSWRWPIIRRPLVACAVSAMAIWVAGWLLIVDGMASPLNQPAESTLQSWNSLMKSVPRGDNYDIFVVARGYSPEYAGKPAVIRALTPSERKLHFLDGPVGLVRPRPTAFIVTKDMPDPTLGGDPLPGLREVGSSPAGRILILPASENSPLPPSATPLVPPIKFSDGPELCGYNVIVQGDSLRLTTFWRMENIGPRATTADLTMFNHVLDENGKGVTQVDGLGLASDSWDNGHFAVQRYRINVSPEVLRRARTLFIGIYSRQDGSRALVINPRPGKPLDGALIPLELRPGASLPSSS